MDLLIKLNLATIAPLALELVLDHLCSPLLLVAACIGLVSFICKQIIQKIIILGCWSLQSVEVLSCWIWGFCRINLVIGGCSCVIGCSSDIEWWKLVLLLLSLLLLGLSRLMELFSIFLSGLQSGLKQFAPDVVLFNFPLLIFGHDFIVVIMLLLPIILPLSHDHLLLVSALLIYLLEMSPFLIRLFLVNLFFGSNLFLKRFHIIAIILYFRSTIIAYLVHLYL